MIWKVLRYNVKMQAVDVEETRAKLRAKLTRHLFEKWRGELAYLRSEKI